MLTKKNKRMVRKMKKYIKTFPLTEKEIDQMIEDITGMAEEAQERNENFETVLEMYALSDFLIMVFVMVSEAVT